MDAAAMKAVNFLATPITQRTATPPTTLASPIPHTKPNTQTLYVPNSNPRSRAISLTTRCSIKPDTDNEKEQNSTVEQNLNSNSTNPSTPSSKDSIFPPISSSFSSSSSSTQGLVLGLGPEGSWDGAEIGSPVVKRFLGDEEERWYMWYYGRSDSNSDSIPGLDSVGLAVSSNGIHWERGGGVVQSSQDVGAVINCGKDWWAFDTQSIRPSEVVIMSSSKVRASSAVYWLYYTGCSAEEAEISDDSSKIDLENPERMHLDGLISDKNGGVGKIFKSLPGLAMSQDGRHWARIEGEHHSGALFDVGLQGEWDSSFISTPHVVFHESGDLRMYYHSFDLENGHYSIGMARSRDGIKWVKLGKIIGGGRCGCFDEMGAMNPCVVRRRKDGEYLMAYEGVGADGERSIGLAVSQDGLKGWKRLKDEVVFKASEECGWDNKGVGSPCLVQMDGETDEWRLYYRGVGNEGRTGIGMAVSGGGNVGSFRRWAGFRL